MYFKSCFIVTLFIIASSQCYTLKNKGDKGKSAFFADFCRKNGGQEADLKIVDAVNEGKRCVQRLGVLYISPFSDRNSIIDNFCSNLDSLKVCGHTYVNTFLSTCTSEGRNETTTERKLLDSMLDFACRKEDDEYMILQFATHGVDCFEEKQADINTCLPSEKYQQLSDVDRCEKLTTGEQCILPLLKTCKDPSAGHFFEMLFKEIKQVLSCKSVNLDIDNKIEDTTATSDKK